jgi:hypothetical protein
MRTQWETDAVRKGCVRHTPSDAVFLCHPGVRVADGSTPFPCPPNRPSAPYFHGAQRKHRFVVERRIQHNQGLADGVREGRLGALWEINFLANRGRVRIRILAPPDDRPRTDNVPYVVRIKP